MPTGATRGDAGRDGRGQLEVVRGGAEVVGVHLHRQARRTEVGIQGKERPETTCRNTKKLVNLCHIYLYYINSFVEYNDALSVTA